MKNPSLPIKLYQFKPMWELPNASPYCMLLETYLRMAKLPFETIIHHDPRTAPKKKLPYIEDNGKILPDTWFIIEYLKKNYGDRLDAHLSPAEAATSLAFQHLIREHFFWITYYLRWAVDENWKKVKAEFFAPLPALIRPVVAGLMRKQCLEQLDAQGTARHSLEEIYELGKSDLNALSHSLDKKPFFMGENPTTLDATAYAFLANLIWAPIESPVQTYAKKLKNLTMFCERMKKKYY